MSEVPLYPVQDCLMTGGSEFRLRAYESGIRVQGSHLTLVRFREERYEAGTGIARS